EPERCASPHDFTEGRLTASAVASIPRPISQNGKITGVAIKSPAITPPTIGQPLRLTAPIGRPATPPARQAGMPGIAVRQVEPVPSPPLRSRNKLTPARPPEP